VADADDADDVAELGHRNLISYSRALAGWSDRGALREADGVVAFASGSWLPIGCNGAFRTSDVVPASSVIEAADAFFAEVGRGYSIKVRDDGPDEDLRAACDAAGVTAFESSPQMACRQRLVAPELPTGVELRRVVDAAGLADFVSIDAEAYATYGMPEDVIGDMVARADVVLNDPRTAFVVAYREGEPMATSLVYVSEGTASLQWVGTRPAARGLGLGAAVTVWATNEAFDRGAGSCTLQASTMGAPLYAKLGYETLYHYAEHVRWETPKAASPE
jgi:GNAT superfamily N-acetyltransferase